MPVDDRTYYQADLARVHHDGYSRHVEQTRPGIVALLRQHGLRSARDVLDGGSGSGLLARALLAEGYAVRGVDASPAMIGLAREMAPGAAFEVLRLPAGATGRLPAADAVVSTGHVLNYLDSGEEISRALGEMAAAVRPGGLLAVDP